MMSIRVRFAAAAGTALAVLAIAPAGAGAVSFSGPTEFSTGVNTGPVSVAVGEFGNDPNQDLAFANEGTDSVSWLSGQGTGSFGPALFNGDFGSIEQSVAVGEFNHDGDQDLVVADWGQDTVSVLLGNGFGGFPTRITMPAGSTPVSVAVGFFDEDADQDIVVANQFNSRVSVLLGFGTGFFSLPTDFDVGIGPRSVAVGLIDNDQDADLVVANQVSDTVSVLLGDGLGTFGPATSFPAGDGPVSVAVGDFNNNGANDLVTAGLLSDDASVLLGAGDGTFGASTSFGAGFDPVSVAVADFDDDLNLDLAIANATSDNVSVLTGSGTGLFSAKTDFGAGNGPRSVAVGDFDNNGLDDLVTANNGSNDASVLLGRAEPTLSTQATANAPVGGQISDTATLAGGSAPTGTITFNAYAPGDTDCTGAVAFTDTATVSGNGAYTTNPAFTPTQLGTYRWIASYSGNPDNVAVSGACNDPNEHSTVAQATPTLSTQATASVAIGGQISDTATLSGGTNPTGTITFNAYAPGDTTCTGPVAFADSAIVAGNGDYTTNPVFTPTAVGTYRWIASYSGDADNAAVSGACNDTDEHSTVDQVTPAISTQATPSVTIGAPISDTATLAGGSGATGTITFDAYGPNDTNCTGPVAFTDTATVSGNGAYTTNPVFTPSAIGTYRWIASYSGDANNAAVSGACNDDDESSAVAQATPTISTQATPNVTIGAPISDTATLAGGAGATGTITFDAYAPGDTGCTGPVAFSDTATVSGNGNYTTNPAFIPTALGTYRWIASYSGDANNAAVSGACNDDNESSAVALATPTITTQATPSVTIGDQISDTATLAGGTAPTGTITFNAYAPGDTNCTGAIVFTDTATVAGNGQYTANPPFTPATVGIYRWIAAYSGDVNNAPVSGACNAANESSAVFPAVVPTISTQATASVMIGGQISDTATLAGGVSPTGTITFTAHAPGDSTCTGAPVFTDSETVSGSGQYTTNPAFTPTTAGTYRWIAAYSGDDANAPVSGACNDANESSEVHPAPPPTPTLPPGNAFTIGKVKGQTVTVNLASTGRVQIADAGKKMLNPSSAHGGAGNLKVKLKLTKAAKQTLGQKGKVSVKARITFTPDGGSASSKTAKLTVKKK
jgi:hypothetical protein